MDNPPSGGPMDGPLVALYQQLHYWGFAPGGGGTLLFCLLAFSFGLLVTSVCDSLTLSLICRVVAVVMASTLLRLWREPSSGWLVRLRGLRGCWRGAKSGTFAGGSTGSLVEMAEIPWSTDEELSAAVTCALCRPRSVATGFAAM